MADKQKTAAETSPLFDITEGTLKNLEDIGAELDAAEKALAPMEELGMDTSRLRERIEWGKKARQVMMEHFTKEKK